MSASNIVAASSVFEKTDSGLHVPAHVVEEKRDAERKKVRWTFERWRRLRRVSQENLKDGLVLMPWCSSCKEVCAIVCLDEDGKVKGDDRDMTRFALRCKCTERQITRGV